MDRVGAEQMARWSLSTCDISPAPLPLSLKTLFDSMLLRSQESQLIHLATDTRRTSPPRGETVRSVFLVTASQMCLLLTSHSHMTHFCLFIGGPCLRQWKDTSLRQSRWTLPGTFGNQWEAGHAFLNTSFSLVWRLNSSSSSVLCFQFERIEQEGLGNMLEFPSVIV